MEMLSLFTTVCGVISSDYDPHCGKSIFILNLQ